MKRYLSAFLLLSTMAVACSSTPEPHKVGAVAGAEFWTLPYAVDGGNPADAGQLAAVGDIYQTADSKAAYVRFGQNNGDWQAFPTTQAGWLPGVFETPVIDLTQTGATKFKMPAMSGYYCTGVRVMGFAVTATGTQVTTPQVGIGNNGTTYTNIFATTAESLAQPITNAGPSNWFVAAANQALPLADLVTPLSANVAVAAAGTGGFAATAKLAVQCWLSKLN